MFRHQRRFLMSRKVIIVLTSLVVLSMLLTACGTEATPTPATSSNASVPTGGERKLEIFHWWTAPGEREAADAMFKTLKDKYPDIEVIENPNPGGGGVNQRV